MAAKNKVDLLLLYSALHIVNPASCELNGISSVLFHSLVADFPFFSLQPLTNGWKVGLPFRRSAPSAPKDEAKAEAQVSIQSGKHCVRNAHIKSRIIS